MDDKKDIQGKNDSGKCIQALMKAAQTVSAGGIDILKSSETIMKSCRTSGMVGEANKSQLLDKVEELKKLAALHNSVANRLESTARKLSNRIMVEMVMSEVQACNTFFADQLEAEKINGENILNMLKNDGTKSNSD